MYPALAPLHVDAPYWHGEDDKQDVLVDAWQLAVDVKQSVPLDAYEYGAAGGVLPPLPPIHA